ncbi:hypothetical protein JG687_00004833 [Phytophthora cactorum]|uniref:Armadillo-type fold n=1 Tax=Phytophthora cactorum TaxID=29920 RepID=A0A329SUC7_9STRA|nr:hypothetical protein Pcac1_g8486 [Phytophthora cactorum]KAG2849355.1 hypothetical protein PC111_g113 [Phytophthora cactorum]KAG2849385.1 hypothetical protein PC112_g363 [Phytophthora cactorum]KAG2869474.1 hypothetical protein PC113_g140 [Phytophthora cactorum]KAG2936702.1 hypothetical protein PC114_g120 [Phytophthora cactorum]
MASVRRVLLAANCDEECEAFRYLLQPQESISEQGLDLGLLSCEPPVLPCDGDDEGRNSSQSLLEDLLIHLAVRKFAAAAGSGGDKVILGVDPQTLVHWEQIEAEQFAEIKSFVEALHGLLLKSEWNAASISTLRRIVKRLQNPRARQRFLGFAFQILHLSLLPKSSDMETKFFDEAVRLLLLGVTDLWSAIRKDCAKMTATIAFEFSSQSHVDQFMDSLLCVAIGSRSVSADKSQVTAWTEREGALLALSVLLRSINMDSTGHVAVTEDLKVSQVKDDIKGMLGIRQLPVIKYRYGRHNLTQLPRCLVQTLKPAIYQCLRHDQLSVRQLSAQCLVEYASLCEEPTRLLIFQEVISKLNRINRNEKVSENENAANPDESELLDAFEAEGLLDVLARMAPRLPSTFLFKHWKFVFPTLEKYVMHIASSVRQKSSSVVLALANQSLSANSGDEASLKLMMQILVSLSKQIHDESSLCWQRKEGRLLSIDVLVNVLGESLLNCSSDVCKLLKWEPEPTKCHQRRSSSLADLQTFMWAHDQAQSSTWVSDTHEVDGDQSALRENNHIRAGGESLIHAINIWIEKNNGQNDLPTSGHGFWQQILSGFIAQTKEAFESSQFELRRISRQVLPGLMRVVIWTDQLNFFSLTELAAESAERSWSWTCVKNIVLHLRYLEESVVALGENVERSTSQKLAMDWKTVWQGLMVLESGAQSLSIDTEEIVAKVEARLMAFLSFGTVADPPRQVTSLLDGALRSIHAHLPKGMLLMEIGSASMSIDNSLDRQFCIFLVPVLPTVVSTLQYLNGRHGSNNSSCSDSFQSREVDLSWKSRWLCLERIMLSWLSCDDMFRWITLSKSKAQSQLLESLSVLLHFSVTDLSPAEEGEEVDRIVQCLQDNFAYSQTETIRKQDTNCFFLMDIYLQVWLRCLKNTSHYTSKIAVAVAQIYSQRQQNLAVSDAKTKPIENNLMAESWDDWDGDEVQQASPVNDVQEPSGSSTLDSLFQEVLDSLDDGQLNLLCEAVRGIPDIAGMHDIPTEHMTRMQQQIGACVHTL